MSGRNSRIRAGWLGLIALFGCAALAGCVTSASTETPGSPATSTPAVAVPSPSATVELPSASPTESPSPTLAELTEAPTASPSATYDPDATDPPCIDRPVSGAPAPAATTAPLAPAGPWHSIKWQLLPAKALPDEFAACTYGGEASSDLEVFGWSKGFVAFDIDNMSEPNKLVPFASADGLSWHRGRPVALAYMSRNNNPPDDIYVVEGPAGIAAVFTHEPDLCGWEPPIINGMLTSKDGLNWQVASLKAFGDGANYVAGGGAGYLVTRAVDNGVGAAWTSTDLVTWHGVDLGSAGLKNGLIQDAAVFAGGFVMTGYVRGAVGCIDPGPMMLKPAAWLSTDGVSWAPVSLPGSALGSNAETWITRITDRTLLVGASTTSKGKTTSEYWLSHDGVSWTQIPDPKIDTTSILGDGEHALLLDCTLERYAECKSHGNVRFLDDTLALSLLTQSGARPAAARWTEASIAVGPTGIVFIDERGVLFGAITD